MGRGPSFFEEERGRIKGIAEGGFSGREITRWVRRSPQEIANVLGKPNKASLAAQGRPKALAGLQVRQVVRAAATVDYTANELKTTYNLQCSL
ncbi:hypothetical protein F444_02242 [Phytophthora nicotianae P1976]|uniref:Tc3 transposase DNA binding domain-containing protein n=1 Tax=Phytophthora nicotianae P1976 TaxID=1317066 RepID=A0A081AY37_PHYNI|nr:hypothetical protein F444_02242 [Phytophthora nicotianae P1976]